MLLQSKKQKYKKYKKGKLKKLSYNSNKIIFGNVGLKVLESGLISSSQIESVRQTISRHLKRKGKIWFRIFPNIPITSKPTAVRMGKGKGSVDYWAAKVGAGAVILELCVASSDHIASFKALKVGISKLPVKTKIVY
jgi:large subunit ribosomal protein L16